MLTPADTLDRVSLPNNPTACLSELDHLIVDAIRDESGQACVLKLSSLVDGVRRGRVSLPQEGALIIAATEAAVSSVLSDSKGYTSWGEYALTLAGVIAQFNQ